MVLCKKRYCEAPFFYKYLSLSLSLSLCGWGPLKGLRSDPETVLYQPGTLLIIACVLTSVLEHQLEGHGLQIWSRLPAYNTAVFSLRQSVMGWIVQSNVNTGVTRCLITYYKPNGFCVVPGRSVNHQSSLFSHGEMVKDALQPHTAKNKDEMKWENNTEWHH